VLLLVVGKRMHLDTPGLYPVLSLATLMLAYGGAASLHGSGFLAAFLAGLALGSARIPAKRTVLAFNQGLAWVAQLAMFLMLGLLVYRSELPDVALKGIVLTVVLVVVARPVGVAIGTLGAGFDRPERLLLGWAGLCGACPSCLPPSPCLAEIPDSPRWTGPRSLRRRHENREGNKGCDRHAPHERAGLCLPPVARQPKPARRARDAAARDEPPRRCVAFVRGPFPRDVTDSARALSRRELTPEPRERLRREPLLQEHEQMPLLVAHVVAQQLSQLPGRFDRLRCRELSRSRSDLRVLATHSVRRLGPPFVVGQCGKQQLLFDRKVAPPMAVPEVEEVRHRLVDVVGHRAAQP
jgi:hypothetical protein